MHKGLPSFTAMFVASARALASTTDAAIHDPGDQIARQLLPRPVRRALSLLERNVAHVPWLPRTLSRLSFDMVDHLALRARAIDHALDAAFARGITQVVILGAGLDTRAYRMQGASQASFFEVDHPDSQSQKRARAGRLHLLAGSLTYVPLDFDRDSLESELARHGQDAHAPTFWLWEGVVPYLDEAAIRGTLSAIAARSAPGTEVALTYLSKSLPLWRHARHVVTAAMSVIGEPLRSALDSSELESMLGEFGFHVTSDTDTNDWLRDLAHPTARRRLVPYERMALALRS